MRKVYISINDCIPGMKLAEDVFNEYGAVIIAENLILDEHIIERIKSIGLVKIKVYSNADDMIEVSGTELFKAQYNENLNVVKDIIRDITTGKDINYRKVNLATDSIITKINDNREIVNSINEMREADSYLYTHSINVSLLVMLIGKWMKYDFYRIKSLVCAGFLHDIGKSRIAPEILNKPGALSREEYEEMKKHSAYGVKIAESLPVGDDVLKGILMHHEREDGSGYPLGIKGDQIHDFAKIIAVADIYDAMTSNRCYKYMTCPFEVIEHMEKDNFRSLDQRVVNVFLKNIASYYMGDYVRLSTGDTGEIVYINPYNVSRPIIRSHDVYIDLAKESHVKIVELI